MGLACSAQQTRFRIIGRKMCDFVKKREKEQPRFCHLTKPGRRAVI